ncbi:putative purine-nucleoside phosphorylase [Helianthus debilis subsp. tardiflorus]
MYYDEASSGRFVLRVVLMDLEPWTMDGIMSYAYDQIFKPDHFMFCHYGAANNWRNDTIPRVLS